MIALYQDILMHAPKNNALTLLCSPSSIFACHISSHANKQINIENITHVQFNYLELERLIVFNPTRISHIINELRALFNLKKAPIFLALYGPTIKDECISVTDANPALTQFPISHAPHWQWDYCYLYPYDHSYCFYLCGIPREIILQFQLMALQNNWNLSYISSERMVLLQLYKYMYAYAYRPSQLGIHMQQKNNNINLLFTPDDLARVAHIDKSIEIKDTYIGPLLSSCGLFVAGASYA